MGNLTIVCSFWWWEKGASNFILISGSSQDVCQDVYVSEELWEFLELSKNQEAIVSKPILKHVFQITLLFCIRQS